MELPRAPHGESTLRTLPIGAGLHEGRRQLIDAVEIAVDPFEAPPAMSGWIGDLHCCSWCPDGCHARPRWRDRDRRDGRLRLGRQGHSRLRRLGRHARRAPLSGCRGLGSLAVVLSALRLLPRQRGIRLGGGLRLRLQGQTRRRPLGGRNRWSRLFNRGRRTGRRARRRRPGTLSEDRTIAAQAIEGTGEPYGKANKNGCGRLAHKLTTCHEKARQPRAAGDHSTSLMLCLEG